MPSAWFTMPAVFGSLALQHVLCTFALSNRLANEITNLSDAATLYPLFGLGANLAQALAGMVLKVGEMQPVLQANHSTLLGCCAMLCMVLHWCFS